MTCILTNSFKLDYTIYENLINLITNDKLINFCNFSKENSHLLDQPIHLLNYSTIDNENDIEEFTKIELTLIVNKLLEERKYIMENLEISNQERIKLRNDNINLLEKLFLMTQKENSKPNKLFFNRSFLINYELNKFFLEKERNFNYNNETILMKKNKEIEDLNLKIDRLEKKLMKSRENLKQYLVTGKINPEEISSLGLTAHKNQIDHIEDIQTKNQIDFSQDWEKMSINSHNSNIIQQNKKISVKPKIFEKNDIHNNNVTPSNQKAKLQGIKNKIDKYFDTNKKPEEKKILNNAHLKNNQDIISMYNVKISNSNLDNNNNDTKSIKDIGVANKNISKNVIPKIISHNSDKPFPLNRPATQSKLMDRKNIGDNKK